MQPLIEICSELLLCNNFNDALTYLPFFSFESCVYIILLEVASKSKAVGPCCSGLQSF